MGKNTVTQVANFTHATEKKTWSPVRGKWMEEKRFEERRRGKRRKEEEWWKNDGGRKVKGAGIEKEGKEIKG